MELVQHQRLKGIGDRIEIVEPAAPAKHISGGDGETGEDDERKNDDGGGHHGLRQRTRGTGDGTEDHRHDEDGDEGDEQEEEERSRLPAQIRHEVQRNVEDDGVGELVWHIDEHGGDSFGGRVVESITGVLFDNWTLGVEGENFEGRRESVHENGEEKKGATLVETVGGVLQVEEDTGDDERHDEVTDKRTHCDTGISYQTPPSSPQAQLNLLYVGEGEGRLGTLTLGLLGLLGGAESLSIRTVDGMLVLVLFDLSLERLVLGTVLPSSGKLVGCTRSLALKARANNTLDGTGHGGQEIGSGLTRRAFETQVDEVLLGLIGTAEEDLATLVQDSSLVEEVISALRGLVDGHAGSASEKLSLQAKGLDELDGVGRVKTSGTVIPALKGSARESSLGNGDTLSLTTRNTTDVLVTNTSVDGVADAEHGHDDVSEMVGEHGLGDAVRDMARSTGAGGEGQSITHCQLGEMGIDFSRVNGLTTVVSMDLLGSHTLVVEVGLVVNEDTVVLAGNGLEEGCAAGTRGSQNNQHLALAHNTIEIAENIDTALATHANEVADLADDFETNVENILLVIRGRAETENVQVLESDTGSTELMTLAADLVDDGLGPGTRVEVGTIGVEW